MFVKMAFQGLKLKFLACSMKLFILFTNKILCKLSNKKMLFTSFSFSTWLLHLQLHV